MLVRARNRLTYWTERSFVRGAQYRLLLIAALIGLISILGGVAVLAAGTGFESASEAVWWAFLRLTDPGYLGDDVGAVNRTISTILTVLGYVVFLGALVAVMTQWLNARMERLEQGLTPVARDGHVLVLGLTNRTHAIVREVLLSEGRVRRFLRRHGTRDLHIVVMAEDVNATVAQDLRDAVGDVWDEEKVTLRSGTPLRVEHLSRVDSLNAAVIIVPGSEFEEGGVGRMDSRTVKTLLSLKGDATASGGPTAESAEASSSERDSTSRGPSAGHGTGPMASRLPLVVAEIFDARKMSIARKAYRGPLEIVASDAIVSRLLAQNVRHPGLSHVYHEILTHEGGCEIYVREHPELDGLPFDALGGAFPESVVLGVVRRGEGGYVPHLNPAPDFRVASPDRFVHLATSYSGAVYAGRLPEQSWPRGRPGTSKFAGVERRILVLGWNHKVPALLREFATYRDERFSIRVLSRIPPSRRVRNLERHSVNASTMSIDHVEGDIAEIADLLAVKPEEHDAVLLVGSDRVQGDEESDARTILAWLLLNELGQPEGSTQTIVELLDPENVRLVDTSRGEVIISPLILSHMLAHVALRPELGAVFQELFTAGGAEITFRPLEAYAIEAAAGGTVAFAEVQRAAHAAGEIALGLRTGPRAENLFLNPPSESRYPTGRHVQVVTMVTFV